MGWTKGCLIIPSFLAFSSISSISYSVNYFLLSITLDGALYALITPPPIPPPKNPCIWGCYMFSNTSYSNLFFLQNSVTRAVRFAGSVTNSFLDTYTLSISLEN